MSTATERDVVELLEDVGCDRQPFTPEHARCICRLANRAAKEISRLRSELEAARAGVPAGWQLVPKEPTEEMCHAGLSENWERRTRSGHLPRHALRLSDTREGIGPMTPEKRISTLDHLMAKLDIVTWPAMQPIIIAAIRSAEREAYERAAKVADSAEAKGRTVDARRAALDIAHDIRNLAREGE